MIDEIIRGDKNLEAITGLKSTQRAEKEKDDEFPKPIKLSDSGRAKGYLASELALWQQFRREKRDGTTECKTWTEFYKKSQLNRFV